MNQHLGRLRWRVLALVLAAACTGGQPPEPLPGPTSGGGPLQMEPIDCPPNALCLSGFYVDDVLYGDAGCEGLRAELVDNDVYAVGDPLLFTFPEVHAVAGFDTRYVLAGRGAHVECAEDWVAILPAGGPQSRDEAFGRARATCEALLDPHPASRCDWGGSIRWNLRGGDHVGIGYFPEHIASVQDLIRGGSGPTWRRDPAEVVLRKYPRPCRKLHGPLCRFGLVNEETGPRRRVVRVLYQQPYIGSGTQDHGRVYFSAQADRITLERLGGGPGWWIVERNFKRVSYGIGKAGRGVADEAWSSGCCDMTVIERYPR